MKDMDIVTQLIPINIVKLELYFVYHFVVYSNSNVRDTYCTKVKKNYFNSTILVQSHSKLDFPDLNIQKNTRENHHDSCLSNSLPFAARMGIPWKIRSNSIIPYLKMTSIILCLGRYAVSCNLVKKRH